MVKKKKNERPVLNKIAGWAGTVAGEFHDAELAAVERDSARGAESKEHEETTFEESDVNAKGVFITAVAVLVGTGLVVGLMYFLFAFLAHRRADLSPPPLPIYANGNPLPPEPRLQSAPHQDLKALRTREDWILTHYYWIDKDKGIIAIPIQRAMELLAQRGIPPQKKPADLVLSQPQAGTRQTGFEGKVEPEPR